MTDPIHIMLDLETWGTEPGCDIRSIGACIFDPETGRVQQRDRDTPSDYDLTSDRSLFDMIDDIAPFYVACDNPFMPQGKWSKLIRDPKTEQWWSDQSPEAQAAFGDALPLNEALGRFTAWMVNLYPAPWDGQLSPSVRLWSHGAHFDGPILAAVYAACGMPVPWHYRAPRDTRTAFDMAGIDDHTAHITKFATGTYHHALDDAITQAKAVCEAFAINRDRNCDCPFV